MTTFAEASPNIAFIKYWGKLETQDDHDRNLAVNPSLSMTLSRARTKTGVAQSSQATHEIWIGGARANEKDLAKVSRHVARVGDFLGILKVPSLRIESENNFPQGTGIASSASAFAALTLAVLGELAGIEQMQSMLNERRGELSALARRGSGSAARSVDGGYMKWDGAWAERLDLKWKLRDTIVIFSREHKKVPSSDGHAVALSSPLFPERMTALPERMRKVEEALKERRLDHLGPVLEEEAIELHKIAATGKPSVKYLLPQSEKLLRALADSSKRDFYFTLDAGPNVHLISERDISAEVHELLASLGLEADLWCDETGQGPSLYRG